MVIITDDKGVPYERPRRSDYPDDVSFMLALYAYNDRITNEANETFDRAFKRALTRKS